MATPPVAPPPEAVPVDADDTPPPRRRHWVLRAVLAGAVLGALLVAGRKYYDELHRLRDAPAGLVAFIALLYLASRYPAADVMRVSLRRLGHRLGRYEAFMLQMVQSYGNVLVPRAGIGLPALYLKLRHGVGFADVGAVQLLSLSLLQMVAIGLSGLACLFLRWAWYGSTPDRPMVFLFAGVAAACVTPLALHVRPSRFGHGRVARFLSHLLGAWRRLGRSPGLVARTLLTQAAMLAVRAVRIQVCFQAVGQPVPYLGAFVASLLADVAFVASVTPAALGFREGAIVYAAPRVLGTTGDVAMAAAVLDRVITIVCNIVVGQVGVWRLIRPALRGGGRRVSDAPPGHGTSAVAR